MFTSIERRYAALACLSPSALSSRWCTVSLMSALISGCFDVQQAAVEQAPPTLMIDDFEDGDNVPSSSLFAPWHCETSPGPPRASCGPVVTGFTSGMAEVVRFELADPANGVFDYNNVELETSSRLGALDLGGYERLEFNAKLELIPSVSDAGGSEDPSLEAVELSIQFACDGVGQSGALPYTSFLESLVPIGPEWSSPSVALAEFVRPSHVLDLNRVDCLANVESLLFGLGPELADGETMAGILTIDDVSLW
jgi:hypothetical protein